MVVPVHGEVTVHWCGPVCISTLQGAFNEAGIARWFELVQQHWQQQGEPPEWASVLDMQHWQGRTPECEALMREAVAMVYGPWPALSHPAAGARPGQYLFQADPESQSGHPLPRRSGHLPDLR